MCESCSKGNRCVQSKKRPYKRTIDIKSCALFMWYVDIVLGRATVAWKARIRLDENKKTRNYWISFLQRAWNYLIICIIIFLDSFRCVEHLWKFTVLANMVAPLIHSNQNITNYPSSWIRVLWYFIKTLRFTFALCVCCSCRCMRSATQPFDSN